MSKILMGIFAALLLMWHSPVMAENVMLKVKAPGKHKPIVVEENGYLYATPNILKIGAKWDVQVNGARVFAIVPVDKGQESVKVPLAVTLVNGKPFIDISFYAEQAGLSYTLNEKKRSIDIKKKKEKAPKKGKKEIGKTRQPPVLMMWDPDLRFEENAPFFTDSSVRRILCPTWGSYHFFDSGENLPDLEYLNTARRKGIEVMPLIHNDFDLPATSKLMHDRKAQAELQRKMTAYSEVYGLSGYNIDFENMEAADKFRFSDFISGLSGYMHPLDKQVSVDITVYIETSPTWSMCYDRESLARAADYEVVMGYDQTPAGSNLPGPNSSWDWLDRHIQILLRQIPPDKLVLGLPLYTRIWETGEGKTRAKTLSMRFTPKMLKTKGIRVTWSGRDKQYIANWKSGSKAYQIWVEDAISLKEKARLMAAYNLAGLAFWRYGFEMPGMYGQIEAVLSDKNAGDFVSTLRRKEKDDDKKGMSM